MTVTAKHCDECGRTYYNEHWHAENCTRPPRRSEEICGRRVVRVGWGYAKCLSWKGHPGRCQ